MKLMMRDHCRWLSLAVAALSFHVCMDPSSAFSQNNPASTKLPPSNGPQARPPMFIAEALNKDAVFWAWRGNAEVQQCGYCHYQDGNDFAARASELSRFIELKEWLEKDKHAIARQRVEPVPAAQQAAWLEGFRAKVAAESQQQISIPDFWLGPSNALSAKICQQMGHDVNTDDGYKWFRESCLTCHGGYDVQMQAATAAQAKKTNSDFHPRDVNHPGISCNYCHQDANNNPQWIDLHSGLTSTDKWRALSPTQKATAGMRDLTPVRAQAQLCFQCHVGNIEKGMFVSHDMYAAGHPPLPAVELNTLIEEMPRHWQRPKDLSQSKFVNTAAARTYFSVNYGVDAEASTLSTLPWDAQAIAVGALVAEQYSIQLVVKAEASKYWGDYALFDCSACHHELRSDGQRQLLRSSGAPGRPRLSEWPHPGGLAVADSIGNESFKSTLDQLQAAIKKRPFGDRRAVVQAGEAMSKQIEYSLGQLTLSSLPSDYSARLLSSVCKTTPESLLDYQAARWVNWSARGLVKSLSEQKAILPDAEKKIAMLGEAMGPEGGQRILVTRSIPATQSQVIFPDFVERELKLQQAYDSEAFTKQLIEIGKSLGR